MELVINNGDENLGVNSAIDKVARAFATGEDYTPHSFGYFVEDGSLKVTFSGDTRTILSRDKTHGTLNFVKKGLPLGNDRVIRECLRQTRNEIDFDSLKVGLHSLF